MNDMKHLQDAIMNGVVAVEQDRKAWKRKEKTILFIYIGAILFVLVFLLFGKGLPAVSPKLQLPDLAEIKPAAQDIMVYYKLFIVTLVFSLIAFGVYFVKSRRSPDWR